MAQRRTTPTARKGNQQRVNDMIRISPVRVISDDGEQLGIMETKDAMDTARKAGLDLVEVAPTAKPPVCRIMDFGKFKYQQKKRQSKQHTHRSKLKELRVRPKTGEHDIQVKVNKAKDFLNRKDKVLLSVMFRGREMAHVEEGQQVLQHIIDELEEVCKVESPPKQQGKRITCTLAPK